MADTHRLNHWTVLALRRLGLKASEIQTQMIRVGTWKISASRVAVEGMPFLHVVGSSQRNRLQRSDEARLVASLHGRLPVIAIVNRRAGDIERVETPGWAFAALLRMVETCPQTERQAILDGYLPQGQVLTPEEREIGSLILSTLESGGPS